MSSWAVPYPTLQSVQAANIRNEQNASDTGSHLKGPGSHIEGIKYSAPVQCFRIEGISDLSAPEDFPFFSKFLPTLSFMDLLNDLLSQFPYDTASAMEFTLRRK